MQIVEHSAKPINEKRDAVGKKKALIKKRVTKMKVEGEEEEEEVVGQ